MIQSNNRVLITGASGFIGKQLCEFLRVRNMAVRVATRRADLGHAEMSLVSGIGAHTDWSSAVRGVQSLVHLAARVHVMKDSSNDPLRDFRIVNTDGTANLAEQAADAGVRRFVYLSTVKVNGEFTSGVPFLETDTPDPKDPYALSKWEAELRLREIGRRTGLEVVILRPPLVYGRGVKGNILRLLRWIERGVPLPFANTNNRRSLVSLENLVGFIVHCLEHPAAAGETFLIADGQDVSTRKLILGLASGMQKRCRMVPIPKGIAHRLLSAGGKDALWRRLWGDLQVDSSKAQNLLGWYPPQSTVQGLEEVGAWYRAHATRWRRGQTTAPGPN